MTKTLAGAIQARLSSLYGLDQLPHVDDFVRATDGDAREQVVLREGVDDVEIAVLLPPAALHEPDTPVAMDLLCQIVEGVSHFVLLAERIRQELPTTELELELQAEVDKFVVLAGGRDDDARALRERLYERVTYLHADDSELGARYRTANRLAARFCARLGPPSDRLTPTLRRFFRAGQEEKIWMTLAA